MFWRASSNVGPDVSEAPPGPCLSRVVTFWEIWTVELKIRAVSPPGPEGAGWNEWSWVVRKELWRQGDSKRVGLSLCPLSQSSDLHPCVCVCMLSLLSHVRIFCNPVDCAPQVPLSMGILQARILEWVVMPSSRGSSQPRYRSSVSYIYLHWQLGSLPLVPPGKPIPGFTGAQRNETATLSSFSHRLYCLNIFNYGFFLDRL